MKSLPILLALTLPIAALAQTNLSVNANQTVRTVDERVFGLNAVLWDGNTATPQTISLLQVAGVRTIRIPGGSLSDEYHWRTNTNLANTWVWAAGFDKYATLITSLNAQTFVTVNYGTGTPQEAAAWVAYANASSSLLGTGADVTIGVDSKGYDWKTAGYWSALRNSAPLGTDDGMNFLRISRASPLGLKYWEIGNENYGTWESDEQVVKNDPYTYAVRAKDYIAKMKAVDPTIKIGVVSQPGENDNVNNTSHPATNPRTGVVHNGWTPVMLTTLKASPAVTPDFLIYHRYEQAPAVDQPGNPETDAGLLQKAKTWPNDSSALRQQLNDYLGAAGPGVELVVTENNSVYAKPGKQTTSLVNGLYYADSIGNILQTEINALQWWDLRNGQSNGVGQVASEQPNLSPSLYGWRQYGDYGILSSVSSFGSATAYDPYPTYYTFKLLSHFARSGDTVVQATSPNTLLSIFAARRTDGSLTMLVINKDPTNTLNANIALTGFAPGSTATTYTYGKPQDTAAQTGSGSTDIATGTMSIGGTTFSASFAPYSVTVISLPTSNVAPVFSYQPASTTVSPGASVTFAVASSGTPVPTYQWQKNGVNISGATSNTYTILNVTSGDAGNYTAIATNSAGSTTSNTATLSVTSVAAVDFDGDGKSDILWTNTATGDRAIWFMNGTAVSTNAFAGTVPVSWAVSGTGDFDGNGKADILWTNTATGDRAMWLMNGSVISSGAYLGVVPVAWTVSGTGDFNGDGKADIVWTNTATGERAIWLMNGGVLSSGASLGVVPVSWVVSGAGDFNGDGKADILLSNTATGDRVMWFMNGTTIATNAFAGTVPVAWLAGGVGDFDGDGKADIFWTNTTTGDRAVWLMNGNALSAGGYLGAVPVEWVANRTGDYNGDGKADILWTNMNTGDRSMWLMNGLVASGGASLGVVPVAWVPAN